jgi:transcription antitermination factor NusG
MSVLQNHPTPQNHPSPVTPPIDVEPEGAKWFAVYTMARHEKRIAMQFEEKEIFTFLPLLADVRRWSDRRCKVEVPLFSCYAFVRIVPTPENRVKVLRTPGVFGLVGNQGQGTPIPPVEIESLRTVMKEKVPCAAHSFIENGKRVRIVGGCLDGIEGILERQIANQTLIVSVELLQRSISIRVDGYGIEAV